MNAIIGRKLGMSRIFAEDGAHVPVTVIEAGPCPVVQVAGDRVQLGFETKKAKRTVKPMAGHVKASGVAGVPRRLESFPFTGEAPKLGEQVTVGIFAAGELVKVTGVTKGRGFQGVVKRHGFVAGHASHGPTHGKQPGSIGASAYPSRVVKGKRLPGRMGGGNLTTKNLKLVAVDAEQNVMLVRGAIPGPTNGLVIVKKRG